MKIQSVVRKFDNWTKVGNLKRPETFRRLIVYPKIQLLSLIFIASFGVFCSVTTLLISEWLNAATEQTTEILIFSIASFCAGTVVLGMSLIFTNRFLGPIYRLNLEMRRALEDDCQPKPIRLRKDDYFFELVESYTRLFGTREVIRD